MTAAEEKELIELATAARENASALYSHFKVGAALRTTGGRLFRGCNVENASYGLTVCAERVALLTAIAEGERSFAAVAVVTDVAEPSTPCGACRQLLFEYAGDIPVTLANLDGRSRRYMLSDLLPHAFTFVPEA